jgi:hypothetical protein
MEIPITTIVFGISFIASMFLLWRGRRLRKCTAATEQVLGAAEAIGIAGIAAGVKGAWP